MARWVRMIDGMARFSARTKGFRSRFVEVNGVRQHYLEANGKGDLPPVVMFHGLSADAADLINMFTAFRRVSRRVIAVDLPGHGKSAPPAAGMTPEATLSTLITGLDQVLDEPAMLLGNSLGGLAAIRYANHNPDNVRAMMLLSPGGAGMSPTQLAEFKARFSNSNREEAKRFMRLLLAKVPWYRPILERIIIHRFARDPIQELMSYITPDVLLRPEEVRALHMPTLLVWGQRDHLQAGQLDFFKDHLPDHAHIEEPAHFSHCPFMDFPKECNDMLLDYATKLAHQ